MIDSHTHLHLCEPPDAELVEAAAEAGVHRMVTVGTDGASCRAALAAAEDFPQVFAAVGRHPNSATGFDDADLAELEALAAHPRCVAIGETGLDYYRNGAPVEDQRRAFIAQIDLARAVGKPVVIHTRSADDDTFELLEEHALGVNVILHCFSMADRIAECLAHPEWWISFAGNVTYPKNATLMDAALRVRPTGCWSRPTPRTWRRRSAAAGPTRRRRSRSPPRRSRSPGGSSTPNSTQSWRAPPLPSSAGEPPRATARAAAGLRLRFLTQSAAERGQSPRRIMRPRHRGERSCRLLLLLDVLIRG